MNTCTKRTFKPIYSTIYSENDVTFNDARIIMVHVHVFYHYGIKSTAATTIEKIPNSLCRVIMQDKVHLP